MMLEVYLSRPDMVPFYDCSDFPFNFGFVGFKDSVDADMVVGSINDMLANIPEGKVANWVVRLKLRTSLIGLSNLSPRPFLCPII